MKLSELRKHYEDNEQDYLAQYLLIAIEQIVHLEALVDEQRKLQDTFRRKLDKLEQETIYQLEADRDEYRNLYHMAEAKISSREAIIESLSETELAKDVTSLEAELEMYERDETFGTLAIQMVKLEAEIEALRMSEGYYRTGATQTRKQCKRPEYIPKRIFIPRTVRSDIPNSSVAVHRGEYDAHVNQYGAVSIKITDDSFLGIMLYEFDVIEWQANPALLKETD